MQEVGRRLDAFSETVNMGERIRAIDVYSQKMVNSGHSLTTIRGILVSGINGHVRRVARSKKTGTRTQWQEHSGKNTVV